MKLSMWMIANRLSDFDLELHIDEQAPAILNSARLAYATNCVHVYQEKDYVVCNGEGDIIKIFHMDITQAFEIVQGIFDFYEDWMDTIIQDIRKKDYQSVIDHAWLVFKNPMILFDGNIKVLGITRQYPADSMDKEWEYLCNYGYTSLNAIHQMRYQHSNIDFSRHGAQNFSFEKDSLLKYSGYSYCLYFNDILCGRINLLAKDREINTGDRQLITHLALPLEASLGQLFYETVTNNVNVFYCILSGQPYEKERLAKQLIYQNWSEEDTFHLTVIEIQESVKAEDFNQHLSMLFHQVTQQFQNCVILRQNAHILILSNFDLSDNVPAMQFFQNLAKNNPVCFGFSLPCTGLEHAKMMLPQALTAIEYGLKRDRLTYFYHFYDYAIEYLLIHPLSEDTVYACMPAIVTLWRQAHTHDDVMFSTLKCYLENERSIAKTAQELFTHRNTIIYRIRKIQELLGHSLDDSYHREYCRLSIHLLELYERMYP